MKECLLFGLFIAAMAMCCVKRAVQTGTNPDASPSFTGQAIQQPGNHRAVLMKKNEYVSMATSDSIHLMLAGKAYSEILYPGDDLEITIYEKFPVSQEKRVELKRIDANGSVIIVPIGLVSIAGMTVPQARRAIEERFSEYVQQPFCDVSIVKREYVPKVYIFGEVSRSGETPLKRGDRVLDVLSSVGGCKNDAYLRSIKLLRMQDDSTVGLYSIDLGALLQKGSMEENLLLQDRDIIFVPRRLLTTYNEVMGVLGSLVPWYVFIGTLR